MHSFISNFLWYIFNLSVEHFWRFVIDQWEPLWLLVGTDLVVPGAHFYISTNFSTAFRLRTCHFFSLFYFFFVSFYRIFIFSLSVFMVFLGVFSLLSPVSHTRQHPHPTPLLQTRGNDHSVLPETIRSTISRCWLTPTKAYVFCVMETLAVILNCR